jgi:hypothetical protein
MNEPVEIMYGEPYADIRRVSRWRYYIEIHHGLTIWGPGGAGWHVLGARRATRKARRLLERYRRQHDRDSNDGWRVS